MGGHYQPPSIRRYTGWWGEYTHSSLQKGTAQYGISPYRLKAFGSAFTNGPATITRRITHAAPRVLIGLLPFYYLMNWADDENARSQRMKIFNFYDSYNNI